MSYTVEIRTDIGGSDGIPHTFLVVKNEAGEPIYARGFAPEVTGLWGEGMIHNEIDSNGMVHESTISSGTLAVLDENGFDKLKTIISGYENNPPYYNLLLGSQCTVWTLHKNRGQVIPITIL